MGVSESFAMGSSAPSPPRPTLNPDEAKPNGNTREKAGKDVLRQQHQERKVKLATQIEQSSWRRRRTERTRRRRSLSDLEEEKERNHERQHKRQVRMTHLRRRRRRRTVSAVDTVLSARRRRSMWQKRWEKSQASTKADIKRGPRTSGLLYAIPRKKRKTSAPTTAPTAAAPNEKPLPNLGTCQTCGPAQALMKELTFLRGKHCGPNDKRITAASAHIKTLKRENLELHEALQRELQRTQL